MLRAVWTTASDGMSEDAPKKMVEPARAHEASHRRKPRVLDNPRQ
jgi:hypothetical protein